MYQGACCGCFWGISKRKSGIRDRFFRKKRPEKYVFGPSERFKCRTLTERLRMKRPKTLTPRQVLIVLHDLVATALAIVLTFFIRFEAAGLYERIRGLELFFPFLVYAAA